MHDAETLQRIASKFRKALEDTDAIETFEGQVFPEGCCGDAALLLGTYLIEQGHGTFDYVLGYRGDHSHAWIERDGLIIDITADQFEDMEAPVIVSRDSAWHQSFDTRTPNKADFRIYDERTAAHLGQAYREVLDYLEAK